MVLRFIDITDQNPCADFDETVGLLVDKDIGSEDAECLNAFVPIAFAHSLLSPAGVTLQDGFVIRDLETDVSVRGILRDEPIFVAAKAVADRMNSGDVDSKRRAQFLAAQSGEFSVATQLTRDGSKIADIVLTEPVLLRIPTQHLTRRKIRRKWKFWS